MSVAIQLRLLQHVWLADAAVAAPTYEHAADVAAGVRMFRNLQLAVSGASFFSTQSLYVQQVGEL